METHFQVVCNIELDNIPADDALSARTTSVHLAFLFVCLFLENNFTFDLFR